MKVVKLMAASATIFLLSLITTGCENTQVGGSVSYGMGTGYGYPMYYGHQPYRHHNDVIIVKPPRKTRPSRPTTRPSRGKRR